MFTIDRKRVHKNLSFSAICLGSFLIILDTNVMNVAVPSIARALHLSVLLMQWIINGYTLTFAALILLSGALSTRYGARTIFILGVALFTAASLGCALSATFHLLLIFRILQGIGAALLAPSALTLITLSYTSTIERAKALGIWSGTTGIAFAASPVISGWLIQQFGWPSVFYINIPFGLIILWLSFSFIEKATPNKDSLIHWPGHLIIILLLSSFSLIMGTIKSIGHVPALFICMVIIFILAGVFLWRLLYLDHKSIIPLRLFTFSSFVSGLSGSFFYNLGLYGMMYILTLYFQIKMNMSALATGNGFLPLTVTGMLTSAFISAHFIIKLGSRKVLMVGLFMSTLGTVILLLGVTWHDLLLLAPGFICFGFGTGIMAPAMTNLVMSASESDQDSASALLNMTRQMASVTGVAAISLIADSGDLTQMTIVSLILVATGFIVELVILFFSQRFLN